MIFWPGGSASRPGRASRDDRPCASHPVHQPAVPPAGGQPGLGLPPPGSGQRGRSPADGADRPPVSGAALLRLAPHDGMAEHTKYPYLLGGLTIDRVNQVWCSDITYIPLAKGFIYLVAIMDWHSRAVLAWRLSNTLHADFCVEALEEALRRFGRPEIFNTDQGSQFTSTDFTGVLKAHGIKISMDGKGRCMDNVFIERLWRSLKYESVYLHAYASVAQAKAGIAAWLHFYNEERLHQAHGYRTPRQIYQEQCPWTSGRSAAPNGSASPGPRAKSGTGGMLTGAPRPTGINNNKDLESEKIA